MTVALYAPVVIASGVNDQLKISKNSGAAYTTVTLTADTYTSMPPLLRALTTAINTATGESDYRFALTRDASTGEARSRLVVPAAYSTTSRLSFVGVLAGDASDFAPQPVMGGAAWSAELAFNVEAS